MSHEEDLDDLDDFLDEFDEQVLSKPPGAQKDAAPASTEAKPEATKTESAEADSSKPETETAVKAKAAATETAEADADKVSLPNLEDQLAGLKMDDFLKDIEADPESKAQFESLLKEINNVTSATASEKAQQPKSFKETISATADRLNQSNQEMGDMPLGDDMLAGLMEQLSGAGGFGEGGEGDFGDMLGGIMRQLASKEVLYQPLKEMHDNYPKWWDDHGAKVTDEKERSRLKLQQEIVGKICAKFEDPSYSDDSEADRAVITQLMDEMQETGAPPDEIMSNVADGSIPGGLDGLGLGGLGGGKMPEMPENMPECNQQ
ncbi:Peroxisomal biogenesis factor 19 [Yarrowia sp. B02]|nr:Peroxisomal biogenesis factor 19 [Yarrowia sp. B02]